MARFLRARMDLISSALTSVPGGELLDVGCGPGMMVRELLTTRPDDFRITAIDRSLAMVRVCSRQASVAGNVRALVGRVEALPLPDSRFDVVLAMGVLEYTDVPTALQEIARVARPDSLVLVTMLNPFNPYRILEWYVHVPLIRLRDRAWTGRGAILGKWFGPGASGMRTYREKTLRRKMVEAGLRPVSAVYFDKALVVRRWARQRQPFDSSGLRKWMGTAYVLSATKPAAGAARSEGDQR